MKNKLSVFCIIVGVLFLVASGIAAYFEMANEIYLILALCLILEGIIIFFSSRHLAVNCVVSFIAFAMITGTVLTGMIILALIGIVLIITCIVLERTFWKA